MALITQWNTLEEVGATAPVSSDLFNDIQENILYLANRRFDEVIHTNGANWTTTSTVPVKVDSSRYRVQIDTNTGNVCIAYSFIAYSNGANNNLMGVLIDDDYLYGDSISGNLPKAIAGNYQRDAINGEPQPITGIIPIFGLAQGTHEFEPQWWVNAGTGGIIQTGDYVNYFKVWEF